MAKWICTVCGYVHEGDTAPEACPVCKAPASKFQKQAGDLALRLREEGMSLKDAAKRASQRTGISRNVIYDGALKRK